MKRVKGITIKSVLHNGKIYYPKTPIDIEVSDADYELLKQYVNFDIPQTNKEKTPKMVKPNNDVVKRPDTVEAHIKKPTIEKKGKK